MIASNCSKSTLKISFVATFFLSACGGGGGGGGSETTTSNPLWAIQAYAKAAQVNSSDEFGYSIAVDGDTMVVGIPSEDSGSTIVINGTGSSNNEAEANAGAAYVFKRSGESWVQQAYLKASNARAGAKFGVSVAISGDTIIVGSPGESSNSQSVINGGSSDTDTSALSSGAAYVFKRNLSGQWAQESYLKAANNASQIKFGSSVAISGDSVVVGAPEENGGSEVVTNNLPVPVASTVTKNGAAYTFERSGSIWTAKSYLKPAKAYSPTEFGTSVAIHGDTIVVGAIKETNDQWGVVNGAPAVFNGGSKAQSGAAYVFKRTSGDWGVQAYIKAPNGGEGNLFGNAVSVYGDIIAIGASNEDSNSNTISQSVTYDNGLTNSGAVYIFSRSGSTWSYDAIIKAGNSHAQALFGYSVSLGVDALVVGAYSERSNQTTVTNGGTSSTDTSVSNAGAGYIYRRKNSSWSQEAYLKSPNNSGSQFLGSAIAISGNTVAIGMSGEDSNTTGVVDGKNPTNDMNASGSGAALVFFRK